VKALAIVLAGLLLVTPVSAQERYVRSFEDFGNGFIEKAGPISTALGLDDWDTAAPLLEDLTIWIIESDPEPCYASLWGIAAAWSASSAQLANVMSAGNADPYAIAAVGDFQSRLNIIQQAAISDIDEVCA
jgi:hypothetical protein